MENLLEDMIEHPAFVDELLDRICEYNLGVIRVAMEFDIDAVHFGDDWGQRQGTITGLGWWRRFIRPRLKRMHELVKSSGPCVSQHSCGDIRELFPIGSTSAWTSSTPSSPRSWTYPGPSGNSART